MSLKNLAIVTCAAFTLLALPGHAVGRGASLSGASSLGFGIALMSPNQSDVNSWIDSVGASGTKNLSTGYEFMADYEYRFTGTMFSMMFRPSYFMQNASGGGVEAKMTGMTLFPMLRLYPLENGFIKFFMQIGLGYGQLKTELSNGANSGSFDGSAFGMTSGLGAQFCFTDVQCMVIEGNVRYLPIERNTGKTTGTLGGNITQPSNASGELELNGKDLGTTLSGVQGVLGYKLNF